MPSYRNEEPFELPVKINGATLMFPAKLVQMGYTYKIFVTVKKQQVIFEPDEERNFRAIIEDGSGSQNIPVALLQAVGESIDRHFR
jgi:hypothetical protein